MRYVPFKGRIKMVDIEGIREDIIIFGHKNPLYFNPKELVFSNEFRKYCRENRCGYYGTNWMCPPGIGEIEDLKKRTSSFKHGIVFQTIKDVEDVKDEKAVIEIREKHNRSIRSLAALLRAKYKIEDILSMGAGPCIICNECTYKHGKECINKKEAISSPEAYGIDVGKLLESVGLSLVFEDKRISLVGLILFNF